MQHYGAPSPRGRTLEESVPYSKHHEVIARQNLMCHKRNLLRHAARFSGNVAYATSVVSGEGSEVARCLQ